MAEPPPKARPLPLFAWEKQQRAQRQRVARVRRLWLRRSTLLGLGMAALGLTIAWPPLPRLVWNASASAPIGLYAVSPGTAPGRGDMVIEVVVRTPTKLSKKQKELLKQFAALTEDECKEEEEGFFKRFFH